MSIMNHSDFLQSQEHLPNFPGSPSLTKSSRTNSAQISPRYAMVYFSKIPMNSLGCMIMRHSSVTQSIEEQCPKVEAKERIGLVHPKLTAG